MSTIGPALELRLWQETPWSESVASATACLTEPPSASAETHARRSGLLESLPLGIQTGLVTVLLVTGWLPSLPFQPTVVGALWANVFLSGYYVGTLGRGRWWGGGIVLVGALLATSVLGRLTDIGWEESLLLSALLLLAGWGTTLLDSSACPPHRSPDGRPSREPLVEVFHCGNRLCNHINGLCGPRGAPFKCPTVVDVRCDSHPASCRVMQLGRLSLGLERPMEPSQPISGCGRVGIGAGDDRGQHSHGAIAWSRPALATQRACQRGRCPHGGYHVYVGALALARQ